ncbi:hypothetical protein SADUNF_Sadunf18G0064400 [Salix dunnii]|uniref:Uncharacterized protein n=1 Tax=Salix dunnii TaxID=1413687 RepID=A0A835J3R8_9ROSI|nr:hypothetical protein SADUNF_Sadunf18G0064400 [Salix dunnii]
MARLITVPLILILLSFSHGSSDARKFPYQEKGDALLPENLVLNMLPKRPAPPSSPSGGVPLILILILLSFSHGSSDARKIPYQEKGDALLPENLVLNMLPKGPAPPSSPSGGGNPAPILSETERILASSQPGPGEGN